MTRSVWAAALSLAAATASEAATPDRPKEWAVYGHDGGGMRHSPLKQIKPKNVARLRVAWTFRTGELELGLAAQAAPPGFQSTPLVVDGVLYVTTPSSRLFAVDAETGVERWRFDPQAGGRRLFQPHRGVAYWESRGRRERRILLGTAAGELIALDASTGRLCADFGNQGRVDLRAGAADAWPQSTYASTSPAAIYRDLVILGSRVPESPSRGPSGAVRAFDVRSGRLVWEFRAVPRAGEAGADTWAEGSTQDRTGANVWSIMTVDAERGLVFLPVGSASYDFYGGDRHGANLFANSLVALDAATGRYVWHFQTVHHDLWDYDVPAPPLLATVRHRGRKVPAVVQVTKLGHVFVLDRRTGAPLFPVEERPVPPSDVPGEAAWPTQPFPAVIPPLCRHAITAEDLTDVTEESARFCREWFETLVNARAFTPFGLQPTLVFPGTLGGATWSGASFDPKRQYLYVNVNDIGAVGRMREEPAGAPVRYRRAAEWKDRRGSYMRFWDENEWPCQKPPWGSLLAVDLRTGTIAWNVPLGTVEALATAGRGDTGAPNLGGSITTAGGLVFIGATNDRRFRAFDAKTGRELWQATLEASAHATPVTYRGKNGRQYVAVAAGGGGNFSRAVSDTVVAFALP